MDLSRRDLFRSAGVLGGAAALAGAGSLSAEAVAGTARGTAARPGTTRGAVLVRGTADDTGWRSVAQRAGESHVVRTNLGIHAKGGRKKRRKPLIAFAQLSDVHICDAQSPMRFENADDTVSGSAHRPQEILTAHIANSMVRQLNKIARGPVTGKPLQLAIQTGDNSDNTQYNEVRWNIDVLDGGEITQDSGDPTKFEGVMDGVPEYYDTYFWHPDGTPEGKEDDLPRSQHGFPVVPGLLDAVRAPFQADGLNMPWFTAIGNHDPLVQGNFPATEQEKSKAIGSVKKVQVGTLLVDRTVTPDPDRRLLSRAEWVEEHFTTVGQPEGHGLTEENRESGTAYYTFDRGAIRFVVLDSVNPNGFDTGSLDKGQFRWLQNLLDETRDRLVVLASHHTIETMTNQTVGQIDPQARILGPQIRAELLRHKNVVAWVNGHTHTNNVWPHKRKGGGGFWEINTASHIDWPQQARLVEITDNKDGTVSIFTTMVDHAAPEEWDGDLTDPLQLAALARQLGANDWQEQDEDRRNRRTDRNVELLVKAPKFLR